MPGGIEPGEHSSTPRPRRRADYSEPFLILLDDLSPGGAIHDRMPEGCRDIALELYIRNRNELSQGIGGLELAWRRGYQAGFECGRKEGTAT